MMSPPTVERRSGTVSRSQKSASVAFMRAGKLPRVVVVAMEVLPS